MLTEQEQKQVNSLVEHLRGLLARFADKNGVKVEYNRARRHMIRFKLRTEDDIPLVITYDLNETSKSYIRNLVIGIQEKLRETRKARHDSPIIIQSAANESLDRYFKGGTNR